MGYGETFKPRSETTGATDQDRQLPLTVLETFADISEGSDWRLKAACRNQDPEIFFPSSSKIEASEAAKAICRRCIVQVECTEEALKPSEVYGIWGGLRPDELRSMRRGRKRPLRQ